MSKTSERNAILTLAIVREISDHFDIDFTVALEIASRVVKEEIEHEKLSTFNN